MSTRIVPGLLPASAPFGPRKTSRTSFGKPTMANTMSDRSATAFGESAYAAPRSIKRLGFVPAAVVDGRRVALLNVLAHPPAHDPVPTQPIRVLPGSALPLPSRPLVRNRPRRYAGFVCYS